MASNYPTSLDNFTNPTSNDSLNSPSHSLQHANINDAVEAIEAKLGIGASTAGSATSGQVLTAGTGGTTTWQTLTIPDPGLVFIKAQSIGTAVSSVVVTNAFSSTYDNYRIKIGGTTSSASQGLRMQLGSTTTGYYSSMYYQGHGSATLNSSAVSNGSYIEYVGGGSSDGVMADVELHNPFLSMRTFTFSIYQDSLNYGRGLGLQASSTSFTGFTIVPSAGTLTGGTIAVYGYRKS